MESVTPTESTQSDVAFPCSECYLSGATFDFSKMTDIWLTALLIPTSPHVTVFPSQWSSWLYHILYFVYNCLAAFLILWNAQFESKGVSYLRSFSILPALSKIEEKTVNLQITEFQAQLLLLSKQSASRRIHSTSSALINIANDILVSTTLAERPISFCWISLKRLIACNKYLAR